MNTLKTVFLMTFMTVLFLLIGTILGGREGLIFAFAIALVMNFISYWFSDKIVLMMYRAKEVSEAEAPRLYSIVSRVAIEAQIPLPRVFLIEDESANAFATGRNPNHAAVAATTGILKLLSDDELEGVLGHEFAHIKHRDILTGTIVATMVGTITMLARMAGWAMIFGGGSRDRRGNGLGDLALLILAPFAAVLVQLAISRSREFAADEGGSRITGKPLSLANALKKLETLSDQIPVQHASPATAHMFIINPLRGKGGISKLFRTHPPTEERIERLQQLAMGGM